MPKIFLYLSAFLLLCSAGLSYLNKNKLAGKTAEVMQAQSQATAAQSTVNAAKAAQKKAEAAATEATTHTGDLQTQLSTATAQVGDLNGKLEAASRSVTDKDAQIADLNTKLAAKGMVATTAVPDDAQKQIAELTQQKNELQVVKDGLQSQLNGARAQTESLQRQVAARASGAIMNGLRGRVLAVDHNWNFVVLNLGNQSGVNNNATMIIQRGGSLVGRVKITSVEPSQSVADIVPNSVPAGIEVRPGDTVVFPGS